MTRQQCSPLKVVSDDDEDAEFNFPLPPRESELPINLADDDVTCAENLQEQKTRLSVCEPLCARTPSPQMSLPCRSDSEGTAYRFCGRSPLSHHDSSNADSSFNSSSVLSEISHKKRTPAVICVMWLGYFYSSVFAYLMDDYYWVKLPMEFKHLCGAPAGPASCFIRRPLGERNDANSALLRQKSVTFLPSHRTMPIESSVLDTDTESQNSCYSTSDRNLIGENDDTQSNGNACDSLQQTNYLGS
ncbi:unnamed protein product, partial [Protopolystoma xenopodis]